MSHGTLHRRGPLGIIADSIAHGIARGVDRLVGPKSDPMLDFATNVLPLVPTLIQALKPCAPLDLDGPMVKQVQREFAAEEARLHAEYAEKRAALVADFGPRFIEAGASDDKLYGNGNEAEAAAVGASKSHRRLVSL